MPLNRSRRRVMLPISKSPSRPLSNSQARQKSEKRASASVLAEDAGKQAPDEASALLPAPSAEVPMAAAESVPPAGIPAKLDTQEALMQLLELYRAGKVEEAQHLQQRLQLDYPQMDIEVQLERLEKGR